MIDLSLRGLLTIAFKNLYLILAIMCSGIGLALVYFFLATNIYLSHASLIVRFGSDIRPELQLDGRQLQLPSSRDERRELIESYLRILQSRDYSIRLVDEFGVATLYPKIAQSDLPPARQKEAAVDALRDAIAVRSGTQNNIMELSVFHPDRDLALRIVTRLIDMYIETQADLYENPQIEFTRSQMDAAYKTLESYQKDLNARRQATGIFAYDQQFPILLNEQDVIQSNIGTFQSRIAEAEGRQQRLEAMLGTVTQDVAALTDTARYAELQALGNELNRLRRLGAAAPQGELENKQRQYQDKLREIQSLNRGSSSDLHQSLLADYLRSLADAEAARNASTYWEQRLQDVNGRIVAMQRDNQAIVDLARNVDLSETTYRALKRQFDDAEISQRLNDERITRVSVIDAPYVDARPARPRKLLTLFAALVGSAIIAAGVVIIKEALSNRIYLPSHIEQMLQMKVVGSFRRFDLRPAPAA